MTYCNLMQGLAFCSLILSAWEGQAVDRAPDVLECSDHSPVVLTFLL